MKEIKDTIEDRFDVTMSNGRKRESIYAKKLFVKLAYDMHIKNTFQSIGNYLGNTHATVLRHYNTFDEVYDHHKIEHDKIIKDYNLNVKCIFESDLSKVINLINNLSKQEKIEVLKHLSV